MFVEISSGHLIYSQLPSVFFLNCGQIHIRFTILTIFKHEFSGIKYIHIIV